MEAGRHEELPQAVSLDLAGNRGADFAARVRKYVVAVQAVGDNVLIRERRMEGAAVNAGADRRVSTLCHSVDR